MVVGGTSGTCGAGTASETARPQRASDGVAVEGSACWRVRDGLEVTGAAAIAGGTSAAGTSDAKRTRSDPGRSRAGGALSSAGTVVAGACATCGKATGCKLGRVVELVWGDRDFGGGSNEDGGRGESGLGNEEK